MESVIDFKAPWSTGLKRISVASIAALALATLAAFFAWRQTAAPVALVAVVLPPIVVLGCALCMVKGYVLNGEEIVVKRLGWATRLPLDDLRSVAGDNEAMSSSLRLFGNGGLLSYTGYFWNRKIGRYRVFATDPSRSVVLTYPKRKVVITPDDPQRFIVRARTILKNRGR
jgi:hypothetical protein